MDQILDRRSKLTCDKDTSQFEYKNRVWYSDNRLYELKELALSILPNGSQSIKLKEF